MVDAETGLPTNGKEKKLIYEAFKSEDNFLTSLEKLSNKDKLEFYDSEKS